MRNVQAWADKIIKLHNDRRTLAEMRTDFEHMFLILEKLPESIKVLDIPFGASNDTIIDTIIFIREDEKWKLTLGSKPCDVVNTLIIYGYTCVQVREKFALALENLYYDMAGEPALYSLT